jgi:hypothetical protein
MANAREQRAGPAQHGIDRHRHQHCSRKPHRTASTLS